MSAARDPCAQNASQPVYFFLLGSLTGHQGVLARRAGPGAWAKGGRVAPKGPKASPRPLTCQPHEDHGRFPAGLCGKPWRQRRARTGTGLWVPTAGWGGPGTCRAWGILRESVRRPKQALGRGGGGAGPPQGKRPRWEAAGTGRGTPGEALRRQLPRTCDGDSPSAHACALPWPPPAGCRLRPLEAPTAPPTALPRTCRPLATLG